MPTTLKQILQKVPYGCRTDEDIIEEVKDWLTQIRKTHEGPTFADWSYKLVIDQLLKDLDKQ